MEKHESSAPMSGGQIVICSGDCEEIQAVARALSASGYTAEEVGSIEDLGRRLNAGIPELLLLDRSVSRRGLAGYLEVLRKVHSHHSLPIIVISEFCSDTQRVRWLESGADDVVLKPVCQNELVARIDAFLRRVRTKRSKNVICAGDAELDRDLMCLRRGGQTVWLGPKDYEILEFLIEAPGQVRSRASILEAVWGLDPCVDVRTIDVHIGRLRKSLQATWLSNPIKTVRGTGYRFDPT